MLGILTRTTSKHNLYQVIIQRILAGSVVWFYCAQLPLIYVYSILGTGSAELIPFLLASLLKSLVGTEQLWLNTCVEMHYLASASYG